MIIGKKAYDFSAKAVFENNEIKTVKLSELMGPKGVVLFFYPKDFTFICPTEIREFNEHLEEFQAKGYNVVSVSTDTEYSHIGWKKAPINEGGLGNIRFPMVADPDRSISTAYDVLASNDACAVRGTFIINRDFIVKSSFVNDLDISRAIEDTLHTVDVVEQVREHGELCPASWKKGQKTLG